MSNKYLVAQLGARMHYAIPRLLHDAGMLSHFYTDICAVKGWPRFLRGVPDALRPNGLKRLLGRVPNGVPRETITAFTDFGWKCQRRRASAASPAEKTEADLWAGKQFCELVLRAGIDGADAIFTYNSAGLELLTAAKRQGLRTVMEQTIAPREIEESLLDAEHKLFPNWANSQTTDTFLNEFIARERAEWNQSDLILCGSEFVRQGIAACGGPVERCAVVPYGIDSRYAISGKSGHDGPLRILTVGAIGLRKGSPYVLEAAKQLRGKAQFRMVGPIQVLPEAEKQLRSTLELTGPVPRTEMAAQFAWADVFLLPSLCEGSSTSVYEALSAGLPVICTPNTGSVVRDGVDGYIVPIRDVDSIVTAIEMLASDTELRERMSLSARRQANSYTLSTYQKNLISALSNQG